MPPRHRVGPGPEGAASAEGERELLSAADLARTVARVAHEIVEKTAPGSDGPPVVLLGLPTRGVYLARRLADRIADITGTAVPTGTLDPTLYRDDLRMHPTRALEETDIPGGGVDEAVVVLVDRGHRELPIRADYVGKNVPTNRAEDVSVSLVEVDGHDGVTLR